MTECCGSCD